MIYFRVQDVRKAPSPSTDMTVQHLSETVGSSQKYFVRPIRDWRYAEIALQLQLSLPVFSSFVVLWGMIIFYIGKQIRVSHVIDEQQKFAYP